MSVDIQDVLDRSVGLVITVAGEGRQADKFVLNYYPDRDTNDSLKGITEAAEKGDISDDESNWEMVQVWCDGWDLTMNKQPLPFTYESWKLLPASYTIAILLRITSIMEKRVEVKKSETPSQSGFRRP